jgi:O-antigen ligase
MWAGPSSWTSPRPRLIALAALPVATFALSAAASGRGFEHVWRLAYSMTVLLVMAHRRVDARSLEVLARVWVSTAALVTGIGLLLFIARVWLGWSSAPLVLSVPALGPRLSSTLPTNALLPYLAITCAVSAYLLGQAQASRRLWLGIWIFILAAAFLTLSRGLAALWITTALLGTAGGERLGAVGRRPRLVACVAAILSIAALVVSIWAVVPLRGGRPDFDRKSQYLVLHEAAFRMWRQHPWLGVGPSDFGRRLPEVTTADERATAQQPIDLRFDWDPHSTWAGWAARTGTLGAAPLVLLFAWIFRALRPARAQQPLSFAGVAWVAAVALVVNGIHADLLHLKLVWAYLGLALSQVEDRSPQDPPIPLSRL